MYHSLLCRTMAIMKKYNTMKRRRILWLWSSIHIINIQDEAITSDVRTFHSQCTKHLCISIFYHCCTYAYLFFIMDVPQHFYALIYVRTFARFNTSQSHIHLSMSFNGQYHFFSDKHQLPTTNLRLVR
jgi:hypothetical protein